MIMFEFRSTKYYDFHSSHFENFLFFDFLKIKILLQENKISKENIFWLFEIILEMKLKDNLVILETFLFLIKLKGKRRKIM